MTNKMIQKSVYVLAYAFFRIRKWSMETPIKKGFLSKIVPGHLHLHRVHIVSPDNLNILSNGLLPKTCEYSGNVFDIVVIVCLDGFAIIIQNKCSILVQPPQANSEQLKYFAGIVFIRENTPVGILLFVVHECQVISHDRVIGHLSKDIPEITKCMANKDVIET